jgi:hypothetical protein
MLARMKKHIRMPTEKEQWLLEHLVVRPIKRDEDVRVQRLLERHHYLGGLKAVGERITYAICSPTGGWIGLAIFCAAARHLKHRDTWIGWVTEQCRRRLSLVINNARFLVIPATATPNLATRAMRLMLDRVSADWQAHYGHPVLLVETFVDPAQFSGTVYRAGGWVELGRTSGWGRCGRDYYVKHNRPKRLFMKELCRNARRSLQAEHLKPSLAMVEEKVSPRCTQSAKELHSLAEHFKKVKDFRVRIGRYPLWTLLAIVALAQMCGAPRGQKEIAQFAGRLSQGQRHGLGIRRDRKTGKYPSPCQPTFCRLLKRVAPLEVEEAILAFQRQMRGDAPANEIVAIDGKEPLHSRGTQILTAVTAGSQFYLGSTTVDKKSNEIPAARKLIRRLDLTGRLVGLDALHTQQETAIDLVLEAGADYQFTVKSNQKGLKSRIQNQFAATPAAFPPSGQFAHPCVQPRVESESVGRTLSVQQAGGPRSNVFPVRGASGPCVQENRET